MIAQERVSGGLEKAVEGNVLEPEFLFVKCRRGTNRGDPSVHRNTGGMQK